MTKDRDTYRLATTAGVLTVAAIAAIVSFLHIRDLAIAYGQSPLEANLLPLSIDGVVATSSLVMLRSARLAVSTPWLARAGLVLSVLATLAANVASGLPHGWHGALVASWPPVGFVISAEVAISMSRKRSSRGHDRPAVATPAAKVATTKATSRKTVATRSAADTEAAVLATLANDAAITNAELARAIGLSTRTARRYRTRLNGAAST